MEESPRQRIEYLFLPYGNSVDPCLELSFGEIKYIRAVPGAAGNGNSNQMVRPSCRRRCVAIELKSGGECSTRLSELARYMTGERSLLHIVTMWNELLGIC